MSIIFQYDFHWFCVPLLKHENANLCTVFSVLIMVMLGPVMNRWTGRGVGWGRIYSIGIWVGWFGQLNESLTLFKTQQMSIFLLPSKRECSRLDQALAQIPAADSGKRACTPSRDHGWLAIIVNLHQWETCLLKIEELHNYTKSSSAQISLAEISEILGGGCDRVVGTFCVLASAPVVFNFVWICMVAKLRWICMKFDLCEFVDNVRNELLRSQVNNHILYKPKNELPCYFPILSARIEKTSPRSWMHDDYVPVGWHTNYIFQITSQTRLAAHASSHLSGRNEGWTR